MINIAETNQVKAFNILKFFNWDGEKGFLVNLNEA